MNSFKTNTAIIPKSGCFEKTFGILVVVIIFVPFTLGFFLENKWLFISLPFGVILVLFYNLVTKGKFVPTNWVQKDHFIEFDLQGITIISNSDLKKYRWSEISGTHLKVEGYQGERNDRTEDSSPYLGTENSITFDADNVHHEIHFYLKDARQKEELKEFLSHKDLNEPIALSLRDRGESFNTNVQRFQNTAARAEDPGEKKKGNGCLIAFFLPFVLAGLGTLSLFIYQLSKVYQSTHWLTVPAKVISVDLISESSDGTTISKVEMNYEYVFDAKTYRGNSVSFDMGANNIDNYDALVEILNNANIVQVYVNESDPTEAVMIRGVTDTMIFLFLFSLIWNSIVLLFVLPVFSKTLNIKKLLIYLIVSWVIGIGLSVALAGDIDISQQVVVIEAKGEGQYPLPIKSEYPLPPDRDK